MPGVTLSRIDKLTLDTSGVSPAESRARRHAYGAHVVVGDEVVGSSHLQIVLLTIINLGFKSFGRAVAYAAPASLSALNLTSLSMARTVGDAISEFGGEVQVVADSQKINPLGSRPHLLVGNAKDGPSSLRITLDGWCAAVGPAGDLDRMLERPFGPPAWVAAAALGVGELFSACFGINVKATRQVVRLSLWNPAGGDVDADVGRPIDEAPAELSLFGLGHLGQAYLWSIAALPFARSSDIKLWLCDDDLIESPNIETSALLSSSDLGSLKTRATASWLERRGYSTRLLERRIDAQFRVTAKEPAIALSGFDDNMARRWLAQAGFQKLFDAGLGATAENFDAFSFCAWPNARASDDLWPIVPDREALQEKRRKLVGANAAYGELADDDCGRLIVAGTAVAVPFVGALAASVVVSELLKSVNGIPSLSRLKLRACLLGDHGPTGELEAIPSVIRGLAVVRLAR